MTRSIMLVVGAVLSLVWGVGIYVKFLVEPDDEGKPQYWLLGAALPLVGLAIILTRQ